MSVYPEGVEIERRAVLSGDGLYRFNLTRTWDSAIESLPFVMLNPSTADAQVDDHTIRKCVGFARRWLFGGIAVFNLYAFRATKPADLWLADDPIGVPRNDDLLREVLKIAQVRRAPVMAAWGAHAKADRVEWFRSLPGAEQLHHFGLTAGGAPRHPLMLSYGAPFTRWTS